MKLWIIFAFALLSAISVCYGASSKRSQATSASPEAKIQQIAELASKSRNNMITLDDATFHYYAISKPRPYSLIVFLTAAHPKFKCSICKQIDQEMSLVAQSYARATSSRGEEPKVFFVRLDYEASQKIFQQYSVNSVPMMFHIPPMLTAEKAGKEYSILPREKYQIPTTPEAESIASFVKDRTGVSIEIKRSMIFAYITLLVIFGVLALLVKPAIDALPFLLKLVQNVGIWAVVSAGVYTCAISGLIFDIIRQPQMYYANPQSGQIMFFYPQSGNQFVVEGFVIGFLNLGCALSLIFLAVWAPRIKEEQTRTMAMVGGIAGFIMCFRAVRSLYIMKNNWYGRAY